MSDVARWYEHFKEKNLGAEPTQAQADEIDATKHRCNEWAGPPIRKSARKPDHPRCGKQGVARRLGASPGWRGP